MKSAYEIAMSRLESESPSAKLTDAQRTEIADVDNQYQAKKAERRIFLEGEISKNAQVPGEADALRKQLASELARLDEECEARKEKIRSKD